MEVFTLNNNGFYIAPQTVLADDNEFYMPDNVEVIKFIQFEYLKIERAGKHIAARFAPRHYNHIGYGIHVIPCVSNNCQTSPVAMEKYLDNSRYLAPAVKITESPDKEDISDMARFNKAVELCSEFTSVRTGDIICLEPPLCSLQLPTIEGITLAKNFKFTFTYEELTINCFS